jgi:hypothetical protein
MKISEICGIRGMLFIFEAARLNLSGRTTRGKNGRWL